MSAIDDPAAARKTLRRHAEVTGVLSDPAYVVVPATPGGAVGTMAWLRGAVSRFVEGEVHERRRALLVAELDRMDVGWLRERAYALALAGADPTSVPVLVLAEALGVRNDDLERVLLAVSAISPFYVEGGGDDAADRAVASLVEVFGPDPEVAVPKIAVLAQAHTATGALIAKTLEGARRVPVSALLEETLRLRPPVPGTRRVAPDGSIVFLDFAAANRDGSPHVTFGWGPRACPGAAHALALAAGVVEATLG